MAEITPEITADFITFSQFQSWFDCPPIRVWRAFDSLRKTNVLKEDIDWRKDEKDFNKLYLRHARFFDEMASLPERFSTLPASLKSDVKSALKSELKSILKSGEKLEEMGEMLSEKIDEIRAEIKSEITPEIRTEISQQGTRVESKEDNMVDRYIGHLESENKRLVEEGKEKDQRFAFVFQKYHDVNEERVRLLADNSSLRLQLGTGGTETRRIDPAPVVAENK